MIKIPNYSIKKILGQGGMSTVYLAKQELLGRNIALKVISPEIAVDKRYRKTFLREGEIIGTLEHANIIRIHDVGMVNDTILYMAMELHERGTLKDRLISGALDYYDALKILEDISDGLGYAHSQGYIHRDIKPSNILFDKNGSAIITDFGIAKLQDTTSDLTLIGCTIGTARYMSPEQALTSDDINQTTDVYSLGLIFYEMLTGSKVYQSGSTLQIIQQHMSLKVPKLPEKYAFLQKQINKVLEKNPKKRYQTPQEFVDDIKKATNTDKTVIHKMPYQLSSLSMSASRFPESFGDRVKLIGGLSAIVLLTALAYKISRPLEDNIVNATENLIESVQEIPKKELVTNGEESLEFIRTKAPQAEVGGKSVVLIDEEKVEKTGAKNVDTQKEINANKPISKKALLNTEKHYAGIRISDYAFSTFPSKEKLEKYAYNMSASLDSATPTLLLIVGGVQEEDKVCHLSFPSEKKIKNVTFETVDKYEAYLNHFDKTGVNVFLQVEPGNANVKTLIKEVLSRYQHHPIVVGFGVDVEWYKPNNKKSGQKISNSNAKDWEKDIKSYNKEYRLFLKHWKKSSMPPNYRGDIIFVDDSQKFPDFDTFKKQAKEWIAAFPKNTVFFQYGYKSDKKWWDKLKNPPVDIANALLDLDSDAGVFWVDFTIDELVKKYKWGSDLNLANSGEKNIAPYTLSKFLHVIEGSRLQIRSKRQGSQDIDISHKNDYSSKSFRLTSNQYMTFSIDGSGDDKRSELRQIKQWSTADSEGNKMIGEVRLLYPQSKETNQYTWMQIHNKQRTSDEISSPLLRLVWHRSKRGGGITKSDHIWAALKTDYTGRNTQWIDLGKRPSGFFTTEIKIKNGLLKVKFNKKTVLPETDISFWNQFVNYFKAGVYLRGNGDATVQFNKLKYYDYY